MKKDSLKKERAVKVVHRQSISFLTIGDNNMKRCPKISNIHPWSIDQVRMTSNNFIILDDNKLKKRPPMRKEKKKKDCQIYNDDYFHVTVYGNTHEKYLPTTLTINFNLSQLSKGLNLGITNADTNFEIEQKLEEMLEYIGIQVNISSFKIIYIELFKDLLFPVYVMDYMYAFNCIQYFSNSKIKYYDSTILKLNKSEEISFYDKPKQLIDEKGILITDLGGKYLNRWEVKYKTKIKIGKELNSGHTLRFIDLLKKDINEKINCALDAKINTYFYLRFSKQKERNFNESEKLLILRKNGETPITAKKIIAAMYNAEEGKLDEHLESISPGDLRKKSKIRNEMRKKFIKFEYLFSQNYVTRYNELFHSLTNDK